jgi:outer membrane protein
MNNRIEELRQITGKNYRTLYGVGPNVTLASPNPNVIDRRVTTADKKNYSLQAAQYATEAARENVKVQFAGHLPVVTPSGNVSESYDDHYNGEGSLRTKLASIAVSGTLPISSGGVALAATDQARYQFQQTVSLEEATQRSIIAHVRKAYLSELSEISQVHADKQAIVSSQSALNATQRPTMLGLEPWWMCCEIPPHRIPTQLDIQEPKKEAAKITHFTKMMNLAL